MKTRILLKVLLVIGMASLIGCGGGGGGSAPAAAPEIAKTSVTGTVNFPALSSLVAKQVNLPGDPVTYVQAYTIDGRAIGSRATADALTGSFTIEGLDSGVDYVLKATRGLQILKKLIEKSEVAPGVNLPAQDLSSFSTTAVAVASQKLATSAGVASLSLGEQMTLTDTQKTNMSAKIFTDVSPKALETAITSAATQVQDAITNNNLSSLTAAVADLVNTLNLIVAAVSNNTDPTKVLSGEVTNFSISTAEPKQLRLITVATDGAVTQGAALSTVTSTQVVTAVTTSVDAYVPPPRVKLDISTDVAANAMWGITLDIAIPVDAQVKVASNGALDMSAISLAAGVPATTNFTVNKLANGSLRVVIFAATPLPTGNIVSIVFDRTAGKSVVSADFSILTSTSDQSGASLSTGFTLTKTATSSGI